MWPRWLATPYEKLRDCATRCADATLSPAEALALAEKTLARVIRIYGPDGGPTAVNRAHVARRLEALGRYDEARLLRQDVVAAYQRHFGIDNQHTLSAELALGINLAKSGMTDDARTMFTRVCEGRSRVLGPNDEATKSANRWLASLD